MIEPSISAFDPQLLEEAREFAAKDTLDRLRKLALQPDGWGVHHCDLESYEVNRALRVARRQLRRERVRNAVPRGVSAKMEGPVEIIEVLRGLRAETLSKDLEVEQALKDAEEAEKSHAAAVSKLDQLQVEVAKLRGHVQDHSKAEGEKEKRVQMALGQTAQLKEQLLTMAMSTSSPTDGTIIDSMAA